MKTAYNLYKNNFSFSCYRNSLCISAYLYTLQIMISAYSISCKLRRLSKQVLSVKFTLYNDPKVTDITNL